ncbi:MAG: undecaprenyl/decaprenyl-phosphate alpha-N-acetylglucosaminyl 1-phosphate transferase [Pseudomonadota bacterium]|nr:undecaprenyl/decaprenyl-phosphate alpha-N-acetylglucosaminyl 1-phosphate transferase [Pseudomonadota bacterium]
MDNPRLVAASAIALAVTLFALFAMRPWARRVGLVDKPDARKLHSGRIPIIGGICFFLGTLAGTAYLGYLDSFVMSVVIGGALIVASGVADDVCNLSVRTRLGSEAAVICLVMLASGIYIDNLGTVLPGIDLRLGLLGIPITVIAVIGLINAFNMLDGIDGLATSMAMVSIAAIVLFSSSGVPATGIMLLLVLVFAALVPYLCVNLGWPDGRKVFMGDAGSTLLGFVLGWSLIALSHTQQARLAPADVLWCVALPVMDTFGVMFRRLRQGRSPFSPDRQHVHHLLIDAGFSPKVTLVLIVLAASALAGLGYLLRDIPPLLNLGVFAVILAIYLARLHALLDGYRRLGSLFVGKHSGHASALAMPADSTPHSQARHQHADHAQPSAPAGTFPVRESEAARAENEGMVKTLCVLAAPPDAISLAPITRHLIRDHRFQSTVCVADLPASQTEEMLQFFDIRPDFRLDADTSHDLAEVTTATLARMMQLISEVRPNVMLVAGNQCVMLAASLAAY